LVVFALSIAKKWLKARKLLALASRIANASAGVHGSGTPTSSVNTGPIPGAL